MPFPFFFSSPVFSEAQVMKYGLPKFRLGVSRW